MSRQQMLIRLPIGGTILLCLLAGLYLGIWKRFSKLARTDRVIKHKVETPPGDALKYWTAEKMRNARPAELPNVNGLDRGKQHSRRPPDSSRPPDA